MSHTAPISIEPDRYGKYAWFCDLCGWAGVQCDTHSFAAAEANRHLAQAHATLGLDTSGAT